MVKVARSDVQVRDNGTLSIGNLSKATGVPVDTLRTWERRYGFPVAQKADSGHRSYTISDIRHVYLTKTALEQGFRPRKTVGLSVEELESLLDITAIVKSENHDGDSGHLSATDGADELDRSVVLKRLMDAILAFDSKKLERALASQYVELGYERFLLERVIPLLDEIGSRWKNGLLTIAQEHFASDLIESFLTRHWRPRSLNNNGPSFVLATLTHDLHVLPLHIAAMFLVERNCQILMLGCDTPVQDIVNTASNTDAEGVLVAVSSSLTPQVVSQALAMIRGQMDPQATLLAGGRGCRDVSYKKGVTFMNRFEDLSTVPLEVT